MVVKFNCIGFTLFKSKRYQVELWFCSPDAHVPMHKHDNTDSNIMHVYGKAVYSKIKEGKLRELTMPRFTLFRRFKIPSSVYHSFEVFSNNWMIFINVEKWLNNKQPTTLAKDMTFYE